MNPRYDLIPEHMRDGARLYIEHGIMPGSFLYFLLANEAWSEVLVIADEVNKRSMFEWRQFFSTIPMGCWGSRDAVRHWVDKGGMSCYRSEPCKPVVTQI